ncbi:hypothetical protein BDR07DRAFT_1381385 [Suillus spraguei]|nr:hypothetical protein BDR07DRAFT_1381385 [Suillus spraguei]
MTKKHNNIKATQARAAHWPNKPIPPSHSQAEHKIDSDDKSDCGYLGGINTNYYSDSDSDYKPDTSESEWSDGESLCELGGNDLEENLAALRVEAESLHGYPVAIPLFEKKTAVEWERAEKNRALGYNGHSGRTKRRHDKAARELAEYREKRKTFHQLCYLSDESDDETESDSDDSDGGSGTAAPQNSCQPIVPRLKWHKLDVLYCEQRRLGKETQLEEMKKALTSIEKLLKAKKNGVCWRSKWVAESSRKSWICCKMGWPPSAQLDQAMGGK